MLFWHGQTEIATLQSDNIELNVFFKVAPLLL